MRALVRHATVRLAAACACALVGLPLLSAGAAVPVRAAGLPPAVTEAECDGDACQPLPPEPEDPTPGTLLPGPGNPPVHFPAVPCPTGTHRVTHHGRSRCVKTTHHKPPHHKRIVHRRPGGER